MKECSACGYSLEESAFDMRKKGDSLKALCRDCCEKRSRKAKSWNNYKAAIKNRKDHNGRSYDSRNLILKENGFKSYREYLSSSLWKSIRVRVFSLKGNLCHLCNSKATELHHNRYSKSDILGITIKNIVPICRKCHEYIEFSYGNKNTLSAAKNKCKKKKERFIADKRKMLADNVKKQAYISVVNATQPKEATPLLRDSFIAMQPRAKLSIGLSLHVRDLIHG